MLNQQKNHMYYKENVVSFSLKNNNKKPKNENEKKHVKTIIMYKYNPIKVQFF